MATSRLRVRRLATVGFVDKGDDPKAEVVFFKRQEIAKGVVEEDGKFCAYDAEGKKLGAYATKEEAEAALKPAPAEKLKGGSEGTTTKETTMFDVTKLDATAQAEFKKLSDKVAELEKLVPAPKAPEAVIPEAVQKQIDATEKRAKEAEDRVQKLEDQREVEQFIAKAKDLSLNADDFGSILRKISKAVTPDEMKKVEQTFKALAAQVKEAGLYKEIGRGGSGAATEADQEVKAAVDAVRKADPKLTQEQAFGKVMAEQPVLRNKLEAERLARTSQPHGED